MNSPTLNTTEERNRNKLYDALASGVLCLAAGPFPVTDGLLGHRWTA